ncbi:MAG: hypothetical protein V1747_01940 [Candidatus Omnitrophota bacterium]
MKMCDMKKNMCILLGVFLFSALFAVPRSWSEPKAGCFGLLPFHVGQFAEYRIISLESLSQKNRYIISVIDEETIGDNKYFWIELAVYNDTLREISFRALVLPYNHNDFVQDPAAYIAQGLFSLFETARKIIIIPRDGESFAVDPQEFLNQPDILADTFYKDIPDEKNTVDYAKLRWLPQVETIQTPVGVFQCFHFWVATDKKDAYTDEGLDLWRSSQVPFLGIVRMEFSKSGYLEKYNYRAAEAMKGKNWLKQFFLPFFLKNVEYRDRGDTYVMELVAVGG